MDGKEFEMLDKVLRKANLIHLREKFVSEEVGILFCCFAGSFVALIYSLMLEIMI